MNVGPYELLGSLGRGATSEVFRARGPDGVDVAVKVFALRSGAAESAERFAREVRLQRALGLAEGVVPVLDAGEGALGAWIAMPLLLGGPLRARLQGAPWPVAEVVALGRRVAAALGRAHALGIVHRDVKPENILYDAERRPFVADLGLAKHYRDDAPGASASLVLTRSGALVGTVGYLAPEQASDGRAAGPPADVFALAAILYEALTGRYAFEGASPMEVLARLSHGVVTPVRTLRPDAPAWLADTIERALDPSPGRRPADGAAFARELEGRPRVGRRRAALGVVVLGLLVGALAVAAGRGGSERGGGQVAATTSADPPLPPAQVDDVGPRARLRAARLLGDPAAADDVAAVRSLVARAASPEEAALLRAEAALGAGAPLEVGPALAALPAADPRRRLLEGQARLALSQEAGALFEAVGGGGELAAEAALGAARAALARGDLVGARERLAPLERHVADPALRAAVERARWDAAGLAAVRGLASGQLDLALGLARGDGVPVALRARVRRSLAVAAAGGRAEPTTAEAALLEALLAADPDALAAPGCVAWLAARTARLAAAEPREAARSAELLQRVAPATPPPGELGPSLQTSGLAQLVAGDEAGWVETARAGLRLGHTSGLFPAGTDPRRLAERLGRDLAARPDDAGTRLFLALCLLGGGEIEPEGLARSEALVRELLAEPDLGPGLRAVALEALGRALFHERRWPEARDTLEAALRAWHPRPDDVLLDLTDAARENDEPAAALAFGERAVAARDRRARGEPELGRPPSIPLDPVDYARGEAAARVAARLVLVERALAVGRLERATEVALDLAAIEEPGPLAAGLARVALAAAGGRDADAVGALRALRAATRRGDRELLEQLGSWLVDATKRTLRRRDLAKVFTAILAE